MSLMEVLIAMFVLSIGLLGVAALIPMGRFAIVATGKADRSGACGRAALSEIKVRQMLDYRFWALGAGTPSWWAAVVNYNSPPGTTPPPAGIPSLDAFAIDPLGVAREMPANLGGATSGSVAAVIPRITLKSFPSLVAGPPLTFDQADRIFTWHDDLEFSLPKDIKPRPPGESTRPRAPDPSGIPQFAGNYSWLLTVTPAAAEATLAVADRTLFSVSVVVCYRREFSVDGEHTASVKFLGAGYGGGSVELSSPPVDPPLRLRENEWVMLCGKVPDSRLVPPERTVCKWYRVVSADSGSPTTFVSLVGPDWDTVASPMATAVAIDHVVGVYTTTVELDDSLLWNK
jgi:hypothetical protein